MTARQVRGLIQASAVTAVAGALTIGTVGSAAAQFASATVPEAPLARATVPRDVLVSTDLMGEAAQEAQRIQIAREKRAAARAQRSSGDMFTPTRDYKYSARFGDAGGSWSSGHHTGLDFVTAPGTPVFSALAGKVVEADWNGAYGNCIIVRHDNGVETMYAHLSSIGVEKGERVLRGDRIGSVGTTGNSSGPHLHFEVIKKGDQRDPEAFL
ncbi:MAG TPA: M23 family metallopeptidase [Actinomycetota bacterium]|nr:M23 family metallopeptidase [Actinomycetota bacterium]